MLQLVYASAASEPFSANALRTLLQLSRSRNELYGVTGMLLYHQGSFLQILEGPEEGVKLIFSSIERDPRHARTKVLHSGAIVRREFPEWSMGFVDTASWGTRPSGMLDYTRLAAERAQIPTAARKYVHFFFDGLCRQA